MCIRDRFWDAPLNVPGHPGSNAAVDLPRKPEEIQRAWATYQVTGCQVNTDGSRLEANFPGVSLGLFSGGLRYTIYRGTNLIRQEVIAKTDAPSVAYKFVAGLKGFTIGNDTRLMWRDVARGWQHYLFGGSVNTCLLYTSRDRGGMSKARPRWCGSDRKLSPHHLRRPREELQNAAHGQPRGHQ